MTVIINSNKYVEIYNIIIDSEINTNLYSDCYQKVYSLVNQDSILEYNYKEKIFKKLNKSNQEIIECIKNTLDVVFNKLIAYSFNDIDYNIYFIDLYNELYKNMLDKMTTLNDIFKYFHTILNQNANFNINNVLTKNKKYIRNFKEVFNDLWFHNIFKKFSNIINKNILIYFNTIRKSYQIQKHEHVVSDDIINLFKNIKKIDNGQDLFDLYISKDFIRNSNNYYENNYKLELDLITDCEIFIKRLDDIMNFENKLASVFTNYTQHGIKCNLIDLLISPKTSKLCKFMLSYIKTIINIISCNEKTFYKNTDDIYLYANKIKNIIKYIKSTNLVFEDSVYILNDNLQEKIQNIIDEHLLFIPSCLNNIIVFDHLDFKELLDYNTFLQYLNSIFNNDKFSKSIDIHIKNIVENRKYQTNIYTNFVKYLEGYFINNYENHTIINIYKIACLLKEKDIFILQYKRNLSKRIIKNNLTNFDKETEFINKMSINDSFVDVSHLNKIIKDYYISQQNQKEYQTIYEASIESYIINATFGIWNLQTCYTKTNYYCSNFKNLYENFKNSYHEFYKAKYEGRNLQYFDNYNTCVLHYNYKSQTFILNCSIEIADFLYQFNSCDSIPKSSKIDKTLIKYLLKSRLILETDDAYVFNDKCKFKKKELTLQVKKLPPNKNNQKSNKSQEESLCFSRKDIIDAHIIRFLKSEKEMCNQNLFEKIKLKLSNKFTVEEELYNKCVLGLQEKEYLILDSTNSTIKYIP